MNRILALVLATSTLAGCAHREIGPSAPPAPAVAEAAPRAIARVTSAGGKPQFGTFGVDTAGIDRSIAPGDDFYAYVNSTWAKNTPIPADKSNYGAFTVLIDLSQVRTRQ